MSINKQQQSDLEMEAIRLTGVIAVLAHERKWKQITAVIERALLAAAKLK